MAARPRTHKIIIPNLYRKLDKRNGKIYWQYKHPFTGKFHSLGTDEQEARETAIQANTIIAEQHTRQLLSINERLSKIKTNKSEISVDIWIDKYLDIQKERLDIGELKINSYRQKMKPINLFRQYCGTKILKEITALDIAEILDEYKSNGQHRMAQVIRSVLIDVFKEAQHAGEVPPGYNPALATKQPKRKVTRQRLNFDEWKKIFEIADKQHRYVGNAMLLALITGQRLGDISAMKFSDIWDDHLHITQEKTGTKLAIPLSLRSEQLNMSLRDVVARCRDRVISPYLIHYFHTTSQSKRGDQVTANTLTTNFKKARNKTDIDWGEGTPATFHEQRSLSERLYRAQGINTKDLLGHKNQIQTDKYHDDRGKDWIKVVI